MEEYFKKYEQEFKALEQEPQTTEADFLKRYDRTSSGKIYRIAAVVSIAAAIAIVFVLGTAKQQSRVDPAAVYVEEFTKGMMPIYNDMVALETSSELCRTADLSTVTKELLNSVPEFKNEVSELPQDQQKEALLAYCEHQQLRISDLYGQCLKIYAFDNQ